MEERVELNRACGHVKANGDMCGAYALRDSDLCYWHHKARDSRQHRVKANRREEAKPSGIVLPLLEDANAVQVAIQMVAQAVADRRISRSEAGMLLYSIQLAIMNLKNVELAETVHPRYVRVIPDQGDEFEDRCESVEIPMDEDPEFKKKEEESDDEEDYDREEYEEALEFVASNLDKVRKLLPGKLEELGIVGAGVDSRVAG